ncbi:MAG: hypothetical protein OEW04_02150 [Nitrospirota bacterium]|nr:hypothetical protein [Nitrospirota bacterium]
MTLNRSVILRKKHNEIKKAKKTIIQCSSCGHENIFAQTYPYHAGFANQGFLYNDAGNLTFVWSSFDSTYEAIVGQRHPWALEEEEDKFKIEDLLLPAPSGGCWRFSNPARCLDCGKPISDPMIMQIYYVVYEGSINADYHHNETVSFADYIKIKG